jgi:hypothetical protein
METFNVKQNVVVLESPLFASQTSVQQRRSADILPLPVRLSRPDRVSATVTMAILLGGSVFGWALIAAIVWLAYKAWRI